MAVKPRNPAGVAGGPEVQAQKRIEAASPCGDNVSDNRFRKPDHKPLQPVVLDLETLHCLLHFCVPVDIAAGVRPAFLGISLMHRPSPLASSLEAGRYITRKHVCNKSRKSTNGDLALRK
jgi:hypothetical protein